MTSVADHIRLKQSQDVSITGVREGRLFPKSLAALIFITFQRVWQSSVMKLLKVRN